MPIDIKNFVKNCAIYSIKLGKKYKPNNKQIMSYYPLERVELDITYLINSAPHNPQKNGVLKHLISI